MRNPGGYVTISSPDPSVAHFDKFRCETIPAGTYEADTFTCVHCDRVIHVKAGAPMDDVGSMCRNCMRMVCPTCANGPCVPFMKKLEDAERRDQTLRSYGL